ncbi:MAG: MDR family MFS transporter [Rhodoglobus sp.]
MTTTMTALSTESKTAKSIVPLFIGLMITMLLAALNNTVLASALPTIVGELHGVEHLTWVVTAYILASTITMPIYGKLSDLLGRKPLLIAAILIFIGGSIVGGLATDMTSLIVARAIQGLGGGGLIVLAQAAIAGVVPARERGKYMGIMGGVFAFSSVAGPLLGGWLTEGPGWRWSFWVNLPLGAVALLTTILFLHLPKRALNSRPRLDYLGMALMTIATSALVLVGTWGGSQFEWLSPQIIGLATTAILAAALFVFVESKASQPIIPLALFKDRNFTLTTIAGLVMSIPMFGVIGYMPTYLQMAGGVTATEAGLLMIPMMGGLLLTSVLTGQIISKTGRYKIIPILGAVVLAVGLLLLSFVQPTGPLYLICIYLGVIGIGLGASLQILTLIAQNSFPVAMVGTATASSNYFRQVGATLGSAVVGSVFSMRLLDLIAAKLPAGTGAGDGTSSLTPAIVAELPDAVRIPIIEAYNEALVPLFLWMAPLAIISAIILLFVVEKPLATQVEREIPSQSVGEGQVAPMDLVDDSVTGLDDDAQVGERVGSAPGR